MVSTWQPLTPHLLPNSVTRSRRNTDEAGAKLYETFTWTSKVSTIMVFIPKEKGIGASIVQGNIKASNMTVSIPQTVPKLTLRPL